MNRSVSLMMALIRSEVVGNAPDASRFSGLTEDDWRQIYAISKHHDLSHLVGDAAIKADLLPDGEVKAKFEKQLMTSVYRYQQLQYALGQLKAVLNDAKIPFIPLKGSVLRQFYPEPWMRTSCDIDVLVHESDLPTATELLLASGYSRSGQTSHDVSFMTASGVHIELHHSLIEEGRIGKAEQLLDTIWDHAKPMQDAFEYVLDDEMFYYYHLAHMAKHFEGGGGCGIRPFIDLWILNRGTNQNASERDKLLSCGGLDRFASIANEISEGWMEDKEPSELAKQVESFILSGGVYGSRENSIVIGRGKQTGKFRYLLHRIWMPYIYLVGEYPNLRGKRILQPLYEIRRWFRLFKKDTFRRSREELKASSAVSNETRDQTAKMLSDLGLM